MPVSMKKLALAFAGASLLAGGTASAAAGPPPPTAVSGHHVKLVASGLGTPTSFAFGGGTTFEGDGGNNQSGPPNGGVFVLKGGKATKLAGSPGFVAGLAWHKGVLYISGGSIGATGAKFQLLKWSGWNGTSFSKKSVIYTAPKKFQGFNGIAYGPDGRLYVGVDLGLLNGNDHGPNTKSPYLYDILSIKPNGKGFRVFATGIRQPWQFVFAPGSKSPLVSDLGQDSNAKNPPDFVLKVRKGDNYGFPQCNHTKGSKCKGFAKPFKSFAPHTDIMGLAIIGKTLFMTSFTGHGPSKQGGEVLSMPLKGGKVKPVVKGFVAPTVGLGQHAGSLYIGELTGQVFSVKP
jgi:glucose/arabinose dehydrogenase